MYDWKLMEAPKHQKRPDLNIFVYALVWSWWMYYNQIEQCMTNELLFVYFIVYFSSSSIALFHNQNVYFFY